MLDTERLPSVESSDELVELSPEDFEGRCPRLARDLIGKKLVHRSDGEWTSGIIVETEAYLGRGDPACHLSNGDTPRNEPFFSGRGTVYVFKIWQHHNLNVISSYDGYPECILIRAVEPVQGVDLMHDRRDVTDRELLASGPGRLTQAMDISKERVNNTALTDIPLWIVDEGRELEVEVGRRVGISKAEDWPLRFCAADSNHISKPVRPADTGFDLDRFYENASKGFV